MESFEDKIGEIDFLLDKSRSQWTLDAVQWMDFDDIKQIIRIHIKEKFHQWDQSRPFGPWCRVTISNQIKNQVRNNYGSFKKPCLGCPHYQSDTECSFTKSKKQDESCEDYARWQKKKKYKHDIKMTLPMDGKVLLNSTDIKDEFDFEESSSNLHYQVMRRLSNEKYVEIYKLLYIDNLDDKIIAEKMDFSQEKCGKTFRYKQLDNLKKKFLAIAKDVLKEEDILI